MEPRREAGPAAMGHPPWGSSMGFTLSTLEMGSIGPCPLPLGGGDDMSEIHSVLGSCTTLSFGLNLPVL